MSDTQHDERTVFVRNVAFGVNEEKLSALFSDVGPVRGCFLVRPRGAEQHKGFGFVTFSLKEHAAAAATSLAGRKLEGRALQVEVATKRASLQARNEKRKARGSDAVNPGNHRKAKRRRDDAGENLAVWEDDEEEVHPAEPLSLKPAADVHRASTRLAAADKAELCKAVAIGRIPDGRVDDVLRLAREAGPVTHVDDPPPPHVVAFAKLRQDGCDGHSILVHYQSGKSAFLAVWALHRRRLDQDSPPLWARQVNGEGAAVKKWRVILRNLPFGVTEDELLQLLGKIGFVWDVSIPKKPDGRMKGFAFAAFTCRAHAERAIAVVNGKEYKGRLIVADWSIAKGAYTNAGGSSAPAPHAGETYDIDAAASPDGTARAGGASGHRDGDLLDADDQSGSDDSGGEDDENGGAENGTEDEQDDGDDDDATGEHDDAEVSDGDLEAHGDGAAGDQPDEASVDPAERDMLARVLQDVLQPQQQPAPGRGAKKPGTKGAQQPAAAEKAHDSKRGKDPTATARAEGEGRAAPGAATKADQQPDAGARAAWEGARSDPKPDDAKRGSGEIRRQVFVRNVPLAVSSVELSARLSRFGKVKACRLVINPVTKQPKGTAFVEFESADAAAKAAEASRLQREGAGPGVSIKGQLLTLDMALEQESARVLAKTLSKAEAGKTTKDNRNLYLLKEGLVEEGSDLWNALSANDQNKRRRALQEAKLKLKSPNFFVSTTRLHVINIPPSWDEKRLKEVARRAVTERASRLRPKVKQVVILRDSTRLDAASQQKSRGIGFVEFETHEQALVCLRQLNNNPEAFGSAERRPIVEFAVENVKVLKIRERKVRLQQEQQAQRAAAEQPADLAAAKVEPSGQVGPAAATGLDAAAMEARGLRRKARNQRRLRERAVKFGRLKSGTEHHAGTSVEPVAQSAKEKAPNRQQTGSSSRRLQPPADDRQMVAGGSGSRATSRQGREHAAAVKKEPVSTGKLAVRTAPVKTASNKAQLDADTDAIANSLQERPMKRKKRKAETDALDDVIIKRTRALFGLSTGQQSGQKQVAPIAINSRWFD